MNFLENYFALGIDRSQALMHSHDPSLVAASVAVAFAAGYTFLGFVERERLKGGDVNRWLWIAVGSLVMGLGVWSMHFIGMLAYRLPMSIQYDPLITGISILPAVVGSAIAYVAVSKSVITVQRLLAGALFLGAGIGAMHYTGMAGMKIDAILRYDPILWGLSVAVAVALAYGALTAAVWSVRSDGGAMSRAGHAAGGILIGLAVSGMHYTAMSSTLIIPSPEVAEKVTEGLGNQNLAAIVGIGTLVVLVASLIGLIVERRLNVEIARGAVTGEQLRREQKRLALIMEHVADGLITIDRAGFVRSFNKSAENILGYHANEIVGRDVTVLMSEGDAHAHRAGLKNYLKTASPTFVGMGPVELSACHKDGSVIDIELAVTELHEGDDVFFIGSFRDISQRKSTEAQLQQAQKMEAVGQLTGGIAHDFNNMLGVIIGNLDLVLERLGSETKTRSLAESALDAALKGSELNRRLLAFSRRQALTPEAVDVQELLDGMGSLMRSTVGESISMEIEVDPQLWPGYTDFVQLESAIVNIVINARDAMPDGGRLKIFAENKVVDEVYARLQSGMRPGEFVCITITDTGVGMSKEVQSRIFEPFFTTKEFGKGSGLGLSMVFGLMKQSGGHVTVYSEPGHGTTIRLYVPRAQAEHGADHLSEGELEDDQVSGGNETILVVEDNDGMREIVVNQLTGLNYKVIEAVNAVVALKIIESGTHVDLVFSDVVMPGSMDGFGLRDAVLKTRPDMKFLLTSGFVQRLDQGKDIDEASMARGVAVLVKPYRKNDLAEAISKSLGGSHAGIEAVK